MINNTNKTSKYSKQDTPNTSEIKIFKNIIRKYRKIILEK